MWRIRQIFCCVVCTGSVISCTLLALLDVRSPGHTVQQTPMPPTTPRVIETRVYEISKRNSTNQGVTSVRKMCEIPRRMSQYIKDNLKQPSISKPRVQAPSVAETTDEEGYINQFSFHRTLDSYPVNGTGMFVDNLSDYFDPAIFNTFCETPSNLTAVIPVYSTADRFSNRHLLRNSLGRLATSLNCKVFFIIGVSLDEVVNDLLQEEYVIERDILVVDKIDTYRDLNNKAYAMIKWISEFCHHVPYAIHIIDDAYVNLRLMLQRLPTIKDKYFMYARIADTKTIRTAEPRSFVTVDEYIHDQFPLYAYGMVYAFPTIVAERLLSVAHNATYCWIEDVWIGGHVRIAANVSLVGFGNVKVDWRAGTTRRANKQNNPPLCLGMHPVEAAMLCKWHNILIKH